ncbi:2-C-methyl-D-erythritol 4-phosphate cytidylyltransferase [Candidatus Woesearchaeota archaeon]|nr:2-C-methyl-D-erythritol 4-phosphate cytidylyltransferase [Candidatus Woesearchaeota archaeon]
MANYAIIASAGIGKRMNSGINKVFLMLDSEPIIASTVKKFQECEIIDGIVIIARKDDIEELGKICEKFQFKKVMKIVEGGERRQNSVFNGLISIEGAKADDIVVIHNGVNPFVDAKTISGCIDAAMKYEAAVVGFRARDTIKESDEKGFVARTIERKNLWHVQTPQAIKYSTAIKAFKKAFDEEYYGTDDTMLVERLGKKVKILECPYENIKITLPNDLEFANRLLKNSRIGFGTDSHRFEAEPGKNLVLGGIVIEGEKGFMANSDGDVILHALFNAISQGIGNSSIGKYADKMCEEGIKDSKEYVKVVLKMMRERGYALGNVGIMLEGRKPHILDHEENIKESMASLLGIEKDRIGITATSGEGLTAFGKGLGMQCFCVVTLNKMQ